MPQFNRYWYANKKTIAAFIAFKTEVQKQVQGVIDQDKESQNGNYVLILIWKPILYVSRDRERNIHTSSLPVERGYENGEVVLFCD